MIKPKTIVSTVVASINDAKSEGHYLDVNSFRWKSLEKECTKLMSTNAAAGWAAMGMLYTVSGNVAEMERSFANARANGGREQVSFNQMSSFLNLGFYDRVHEIFAQLEELPLELERASPFVAFGSGAFQLVSGYLDNAAQTGKDMTEFPVELAQNSARLLAEAGVSDADVARHLNVAGEILREHKLFESQFAEVLSTDIPGDISGVTMVLYIPVASEDIFAFNVELATREQQLAIPKNPAFDIVFSATQQ